MADGAQQVGLATSRQPEGQDVVGALDEVALAQRREQPAAPWPRSRFSSSVARVFSERQARGLQGPFDPPAAPLLDLGLGELVQVVAEAPALPLAERAPAPRTAGQRTAASGCAAAWPGIRLMPGALLIAPPPPARPAGCRTPRDLGSSAVTSGISGFSLTTSFFTRSAKGTAPSASRRRSGDSTSHSMVDAARCRIRRYSMSALRVLASLSGEHVVGLPKRPASGNSSSRYR